MAFDRELPDNFLFVFWAGGGLVCLKRLMNVPSVSMIVASLMAALRLSDGRIDSHETAARQGRVFLMV